MSARTILIFPLILLSCSSAWAEERGTPVQRAACGPAVRKYCAMIKPSDGPFAYQRCLEANRPRIGAKCQMVLDGKL